MGMTLFVLLLPSPRWQKISWVVPVVPSIRMLSNQPVVMVSISASRIFFSGLAQGLQARLTNDGSTIAPSDWAYAAQFAINRFYNYTRARPPSRTLVDPLAAFVARITAGEDFSKAVKAAGEAAHATKDIEAKAGRSAYVEGGRLKEQQIPDPGAWGVKVILESLEV
jgi:dihydroxyacetone kinase